MIRRRMITAPAARRRSQRGGIVLKVVLAISVSSIVGLALLRNSPKSKGPHDAGEILVHTVKRGDFQATVTESGDIQSAQNVEVRCEVKSEGSGGTTILEIVDEGTLVQEGDFLVQFDDSALKLTLTQQEILVAQDEGAVITAESELEKAKQTLREYREGLFVAEKETFESALLQAQSNLKAAQDATDHAQRMFQKGYISRLQLEARQDAVAMARKAVQVAETNLRVHTDFTSQRMIGEYEAEIKKHEAALKTAQVTLKLSRQRRDEILQQIAKCRVVAPSAGQVVYANNFERQQNIIIEEGIQVREGQVVIRLPNPAQMQVKARVNDSKIKQITLNDPVTIELDVNPHLPVRGFVSKINSFPYPREWYGGPIEYGIEITIEDPPPELTPGQRAKVHILVEHIPDAIQVPIQSVVERGGHHYCLVRTPAGTWDVRQVSIGSNNGSFVVIQSGLSENEQVALTPAALWDHVTAGTRHAPLAPSAEAPPAPAGTAS